MILIMSEIKDVLNNLYESNKAMTILRSAGFKTFSEPQKIKPEMLDLFSDYVESKVGMISTLYDKENTIRIFQVDIESKVTKSLVKEILSRLERRLRMPILIIDDKYYLITKKRIGRGKFKSLFISGDLNNFKDIKINSDDSVMDIQFKILEEMEHEIKYEE